MTEDDEFPQIATPSTSMEAISKVSKALFSFKRPASYKDISQPVDLHEVTVSRALTSAKDLGLVKSGSTRGVYELTQTGETFARYLGFGKEEECRRLVAKQILTLPAWSDVVSFLVTNRDAPRDPLDIAMYIESRLSKRWGSRMRGRVAGAFRSILEYANLVRLEDGKIISIVPTEEDVYPDISTIDDISSKDERSNRVSASAGYESLISGVRISPEFAEFSIPEFFIVFVKKDEDAIDYFRKQLSSDSIFHSWLNTMEEKIKMNDQEEE